jgi:hypothetical protein
MKGEVTERVLTSKTVIFDWREALCKILNRAKKKVTSVEETEAVPSSPVQENS